MKKYCLMTTRFFKKIQLMLPLTLWQKKEMNKQPNDKLLADDCHSIYDYESLQSKLIVQNTDI